MYYLFHIASLITFHLCALVLCHAHFISVLFHFSTWTSSLSSSSGPHFICLFSFCYFVSEQKACVTIFFCLRLFLLSLIGKKMEKMEKKKAHNTLSSQCSWNSCQFCSSYSAVVVINFLDGIFCVCVCAVYMSSYALYAGRNVAVCFIASYT